MRKRIVLSTLLAIVAGTALGAETVIFEDDMPGSVWSFGTNSAVIQTESWTSLDGNVTMDLILSADNGEVVANGGAISLRITSANTNANANRIDSAVISNMADDETLTLTLNVTVSGGPAITNLYMDNLSFNAFASSDTAEFSDGSATFTTVDGNNTFGYTGTNTALTGLAPLSVSNAGGLGNGTWELSLSARDGMVGGTGALVRTEFQFEDITIGFDRNGNIAPVVTTKSITNKFDNVRTVVMNATDPDSAPSPLTFSIVTATINGALGPVYDVNKVDYTPNTGFVGSDSFTFAADDGNLSSTGTITIVTKPNEAPVADDQNLTTVSTVPLLITLTASDNEGQALTYAILDAPGNGILSGTASNETTYTSDAYTGPDSFTFTATDTEGASSTGTVSITVTPNYKYAQFEESMPGGLWPSDIYDGQNKSYTAVVTNDNIIFSLTAEALDMAGGIDQGGGKLDSNNNKNTLGIIGSGGTKNHRIESNGTQNEGIKFTLSVSVPSGFSLDDLFLDNLALNTWDPADTADFSDGSITTNIGPPDTAYDYHNYTGDDTGRGDTGVINLADLGLTALSMSNVGGIGDGTWELSLVAIGDPTDFAIENIDFGFLVSTLVNNPPVADNQSVELEANDTLDITITASDAEVLTFAILGDPAHGTLSALGNLTGSSADTTYTPDLNYIGSDSFTFTATDGELISTGTVSITVTPDYLIAGIGERYVPGSGVTFSDNPDVDYAIHWPVSDNLSSSFTHSVTDTVNDIVFSVTLTSENGYTIASRNTLEDVGIFDGGSNYRIDPIDGAIEMTVSVTGSGAAFIGSLELERLYVRRWGPGESAVLSDGTTSTNMLGDYTDYLDYTGALDSNQDISALTTLTKGNIALWSLSLDSDGTSQIGIGAIGFKYSIDFDATSYGHWSDKYGGVGGAKDDYDNDGVDNLLEYALDGNPTNDDATAVLPATGSDGGWFYHVHNQRVNDSSLTYTIGVKDNLIIDPTWETDGVDFVGESGETNNFKFVTNRTDVGAAEFLQLKVEQK